MDGSHDANEEIQADAVAFCQFVGERFPADARNAHLAVRLIDESVMEIVEELAMNTHRLHAVQHGIARSLQHAPTLRRRSPAPERHARG